MAEDLMIGFKFFDREDNLTEDKAILKSVDSLFNEATFDANLMHLGAKSESIRDAASLMDDGGDRFDSFESFDFTEGFDFVM